MFGAHATPQETSDFAALAHARTQMIDGDHDVFGDGTVILKFAPGHTPGHQCLYVEFAKTGGVLVAGDLYHYAEERSLHRMPIHEQTTGTPASRAQIDHFIMEKEPSFGSATVPTSLEMRSSRRVGTSKGPSTLRSS
jgi:N-acyl homoserine lactone hydrolase